MKDEVSPLLIIWAVIRVILMIPAIPFIVVYHLVITFSTSFAKGYREAQLRQASAVLRKYAAQGADGSRQRAVVPEPCDEEDDSEDERLGLDRAPRTVTVRMMSVTTNSPDGHGAGRRAITVRK